MRAAVTNCGLLMLLALMILIGSSMTSKNTRDLQVSTGLQSATDYALDKMGDAYRKIDYQPGNDEVYLEQLMDVFMTSLYDVIGTDGDITVSVEAVNLSAGYFSVVVQEDFEYNLASRKGQCSCRRIASFEKEVV